MSTIESRLDRLAEPEMPPVNPIYYLAVELALAHPDAERLKAEITEANRTGRPSRDPLVRAIGGLVRASVKADEAGLFGSDYGERLYQATDGKVTRANKLTAMSSEEATVYEAAEREVRAALLEKIREAVMADAGE